MDKKITPINHLSESENQSSKSILDKTKEHEFSEELSDGGERDEIINWQQSNMKE